MKKWIGLGLIFIMFFSSLAFAAIQSLTFGVQQQAQPGQDQVGQLPSEYIVDYRLSQAQMAEAVSRGLTVATYTYSRDCMECMNERAALEQIVQSQEFAGQVILEEVVADGPSRFEATSFLGTRSLEKVDQQEAVKMFCEIVANPPLGCAAGNIGQQ